VPLYLLGLGSKDEINEDVMKRMAKESGGSYDRVENQEQLFKVFEKLSIEISRRRHRRGGAALAGREDGRPLLPGQRRFRPAAALR